MSADPRTLVVMATNRGVDIVTDQLAAIERALTQPWHAVIVDDAGDLPASVASSRVTVIPSSLASKKHLSGFKIHEGIRHALAAGIPFRVAWCLDDDALPIGRGIDAWALDRVDVEAADLVGTLDRVDYGPHWPRWRPYFELTVPEVEGFIPRRTLFYGSVWMSRELCEGMASRQLLVPDWCEAWDLWPDVYVSWAAQLLGYAQEAWGTMDVPRPPLYCNHPDTMAAAPQPWILDPAFLVYHSVRAVPGFAEDEVRARCRGSSRWSASSSARLMTTSGGASIPSRT